MQDFTQQIAKKLLQLRKQRGWSLDKTAAATGVSKAMLGQIERGESSPTVATLWKIATGFDVSFSSFIETAEPKQTIWRNSETVNVDHWHAQDIKANVIIPFDQDCGFELLLVTLPAEIEHISDAHAMGVIEHVIVLNGSLDINIDNNWQTLNTGDAIRFDASHEHGYRNPNAYPVSFHNVICYTTA